MSTPFDIGHGTVSILGRIDRIDYHELTNTIRILDYKTADTPETPERKHGGRNGWTDVQLPLYRHVWRQCMATDRVPDGAVVELGFFQIPKDPRQVDVAVADWEDATLQVADALARNVIEKIRAEEFDELTSPPPAYFAGSGKTFRLTNRYLALLAAGIPPAHIWAATFTRKAAGEIVDRIVKRLAEATRDEGAAQQLGGQIGRADLTKADFARLLRDFLAAPHRLRIGTFDSLFLYLARTFSLELGLSPGWAICDETDATADREAAIDAVMTGDAIDRDWLDRVYFQMTHGVAARAVRADLLTWVQELYDAFLSVPRAGWCAILPPPPVGSHDGVLGEMAAVEIGKDKRMAAARDKDVERARQGLWEDFVRTGLAAKAYSGESTYFNQPIPPALLGYYERLKMFARHAVRNEHAAESKAAWTFLDRFHAHLAATQRVRGGLRFDDVTRALGEHLDPATAGFDYRVGGSVGHLLLDEFQDTSTGQWKVLKSLAATAMTAGGTVFGVGDIKQAIFGWRGGRAELLERLPGELGIENTLDMDESRRSARTVIETVNTVFRHLSGWVEDEVTQATAAEWQARFHEHTTARADVEGYVQVETGPGQLDHESLTALRGRHYAWTARKVAALMTAKPTTTVGVLCRTNKAVGRLIFELRQAGVAASEEGGNAITDSAAVEVILSLLQLADHPGDTVAAFHLGHCPMTDQLRAQAYDAGTPAVLSQRIRSALLAEGYGAVIAAWADRLAAVCPVTDRVRLTQLVEAADAYQPRATLRPADFVAWVREQKMAAPTASRVRVLTLHKAKGLEFDAVVLPELDVGLTGRPAAFVVADPDPPRLPHGFVGRRVATGLRSLFDDVTRKHCEAAERREFAESLSLLYVAVTRARDALYIFAPGPHRKARTDHWDTVLLKALCPAMADVKNRQAETVIRSVGSEAWQPEKRPEPSPPARSAAALVRLRPSEPARRRLEWVAPTDVDDGRRIDADRLFADSDPRRRQIGLLHHSWFAAVGWLDDGEPSDEELCDIARRLPYAGDDLAEQIGRFRDALCRPTIRTLLSRTAHDGDSRVERERGSQFAMATAF